jgi:hypothetical protein
MRKIVLGGAAAVAVLMLWLLMSREEWTDPVEPQAQVAKDMDHGESPGATSQQPVPRIQPSSEWSWRLFQLAEASQPGPYRPGSGVYARPFDDSDPEMKALMAQVYAQGGCAQPGERCKPASDLLVMGGDRLASYLITQFERSLKDGYPDHLTYLSYIAKTESETGFEYVLDRVRRKGELSVDDWRYAARALSHTGQDGAVDEALRLLATETDPGVLDSAVNTLWRVAEARNHLRRDSLEKLLELEASGPPRLQSLASGVLDRLSQNFQVPERTVRSQSQIPEVTNEVVPR